MAPKKKVKSITIKGVSMSGLTKREQEAMKKHSQHHTAKHLKDMVKRMSKGASFSSAHKQSQKAVGK